MNTDMENAFSKLLNIIQSCREKVTVVKPDDEWQEYSLCCLQEFFSEIENTTLSCIREIEHCPTYPSSYERFESAYRMFDNFSWFDPTQSENARIDPPSLGRCLELMSELVGKNERQMLCRAMNEIIVNMLQPEL